MRAYVFRVVVPRRDWERVRWISELLERENIELLYTRIDRLFSERADLDSIEVSFLMRGDAKARRELERKLAESLRGSIGFFISYVEAEG